MQSDANVENDEFYFDKDGWKKVHPVSSNLIFYSNSWADLDPNETSSPLSPIRFSKSSPSSPVSPTSGTASREHPSLARQFSPTRKYSPVVSSAESEALANMIDNNCSIDID